MRTPNFKTRKTSGHAQIYYDISLGKNKRLVGKTDVIVNTKYWNTPKDVKNAKGNKIELPTGIDFAKAQNINKVKEATANQGKLDDFIDWFESNENDTPIHSIDDPDQLRHAIDIYYGRVESSDSSKVSLKNYFDEHIVYLQEEKKVIYRTIYYYEKLRDLMQEFCKYKKMPFAYESFTNKNTLLFKRYLREKKGFSDGTWNTYLQKLKAVMGRSYDLEYHDMRQFRVAKPVTVKTQDIYLKESELQAIMKLELTDTIDIAARDYWILMSRSGERVSDVIGGTKAIGKKNGKLITEELKPWDKSLIKTINGKLVIEMTAEKTGKSRHFIVTDEILEIIKRNGLFPSKYGFPYDKGIKMSKHTLTKRVRNLARLAGMDKDRVNKIKPHSARKTAVTLAYLGGMSIMDIRGKITLHKSDQTTINYIMANDTELKGIMRTRGDVA